MPYLYETHLHTSAGSRCAYDSPEEQVKRYHRYGYTGIFVTEHFLNGNTTVPKGLSWTESINAFFEGYERAFSVGKEYGLDVFFGFESSYRGNDILTYGLGKDWLISHPEIMEMSMREYCEFARSEGGLVVHAHPFRETIDTICLIPRSVDAVEVLNGCRSDFENDRAAEFARNYDLAVTGGSDIHRAQHRLCGISSSVRFSDVGQYCNAVRNREVSSVVVFDGRPNVLCE